VLLLAARDGLSQEELLSVLDGPNGEPVPRAVATPFFFAAEPVLTLSDDQMVIRTGTIERAVRDAVIGPLTDRMRAHERLSDLFRILDDGESRKLRELPMHLMATEQWQELRDLLVRPAFLTPLIEHHQEDLAFWWERLRVHFDPVESYEITWRELEQAADRDEAWASSSESIGKALYLLGHPAPAASVLSEVVEAVASTHGRNNPKYADAARALGVALSEAGRHQDAVPWLRDALESDRNSLGLYNQETLSALSSLAGCLAYLGDHEAAEPLLRQVIDANSEIFGRRDPVTLIAINNLVGSFLMHGDFEEAEPLQREVIEILRETRSEDDRFFLTAMNNWASILEGKAAFDEAEQLYRKVLAGRERVLGEEHPETVQAMSNLAKLLQHTGNLGGAAALFVEALAILDRAPAVNRFDQAVISQNYGALLSMMNDSAAAEHWCRRGLELFRAALPSGHPHLLAAMTNLAVVMLEIKNPTAATPLLQEAFAGYRRTMGIHHPYTKNVTLLFAHVLAEQDDRGAAAALLFEADLAQSSNDIDSDDSVRIDSSDADSIDVDPTVRALSALATAHEYSDIYKLVERFAFVTSTEFIARLEALGGTLSTEESSALLERVALLRHLAAGKPLTAVSNPVVEAFAALRRAARQGDEPMLLRLYPFLRSSVVLENLREMAAENNNCVAAENVDRVARYAAK
jgi:tetratricopeptide (TPR) repeat protein